MALVHNGRVKLNGPTPLPEAVGRLVLSVAGGPEPLGLRVRFFDGSQYSDWFELLDGGSVLQPGLNVDTLILPAGSKAIEVRTSCKLDGPLYYAAWTQVHPSAPSAFRRMPKARSLDVEFRSQMVEEELLARRICLPTSLAMVLQYLGTKVETTELARRCYDKKNAIYGNWLMACRTAGFYGYSARVVAMERLGNILPWLDKGIPLIVSVAYGEGELPGSPISATKGHLLVIRGVDRTGNILCCDPAAIDSERGIISYPQRAFARCWKGVAIVVY